MRPQEPTGGGWDPPSEPRDVVEISIAVDQPTTGAVLRGRSDGVTVAVSGRAWVDSGAGKIAAVDVRFADGDWQPAQSDAPNFSKWSISTLVPNATSLVIVARARHSSGLVQQAEVDVTTEITPDPPAADTVPPSVAFTSPLPSSVLVADAAGHATLTVTGTAADAGSGIASVDVAVDGVAAAVQNVSGDWKEWRADISLTGLGAHVVSARAVDGASLSMEATLPLSLLSAPPKPPLMERLLLVEKLRLSSYLGAYGAGRTIKTITLLPGECTTLTLNTYKRTEETATQASSMLDSFTTESQQDFESTLTAEQSNKQTSDESLKWNVSGSASAGWGWGSASITAGASGGTNAAREEVAKNIANTVQKHAAKASSKRDIDVKSSQEDKTETGDELSTQTEIKNINVSRTLNFVFRQMNQEFITLLTLNDIRVGYVRIDEVDGALYTLSVDGDAGSSFKLGAGGQTTAELPVGATATELQLALSALGSVVVGNVAVTSPAPGTYSIAFDRGDVALSATGIRTTEQTTSTGETAVVSHRIVVDVVREGTVASYQEVTLSQLDALLRRVLNDAAIPKVRQGILDVLANVFDYQDEPHAMVEERVLTALDGTPLPNGRYLRAPKGKTSTYTDEATGTKITVPGVILSAMRNILRTDAVMADAMLGLGQALDGYSQGLQDAAVKAKQLENDREQVAIDRDRLAIGLIEAGNTAGAGIWQTVYPPDELDRLALATLPVGADGNGSGG